MNGPDCASRFDPRQGLKAVAIYSVITAHITLYACTFPLCWQLSRVLILFGFMGVGVFFALLGLDWSVRHKRTIFQMFRLDIPHYIVPSVVSGVLIYLGLWLRKGDPGIGLVDFVLGNGSYLWFIPIFLILRYLRAAPFSGPLFLMFLPVSYVVYSHAGQYELFGLHPHLNIFYWLPYVFLGRCSPWLLKWVRSRENTLLEWLLGICGVVLPFVIYVCFPSIPLTYFNFSVLLSSASFFFGALTLFSSGSALPALSRTFSLEFFNFLSGQTLFIYLWHMLVAGMVSRLLGHGIYILLAPLVVLVFLFFVSIVIRFLSSPLLFLCTGIKPPALTAS